MRMTMAILALAATTAAGAQERAMAPMAVPACKTQAALPAAFAKFARPMPVALGGTVLVGDAATLGLGPAAGMVFAVTPAKAPATGTFGGTVGFDVKTAGTYRIAVGAPMWIDLVQGGNALASTAHGHGPDCTPVRKTVDFALAPGHYTIQLSGAAQPRATVMVAKAG